MTCNVVLGLLFPSLNLTFMGHFLGNSDFLKYITLPLTLPDGRNETWLLFGEALRITKEALSLYPDLWVSELVIGLLFSLWSHSSAHPAFARRRCGAWQKMAEASPRPTCLPRGWGHCVFAHLWLVWDPHWVCCSGKLALHCPLSILERDHTLPSSTPAAVILAVVCPVATLLGAALKYRMRSAKSEAAQDGEGCSLWLLSSLTGACLLYLACL